MSAFRTGMLTAILCFVTTPALAQPMQINVSGFGGGFLAGRELVVFEDPFPFFEFGQEASFALGGRVAVWPTSRLGIEAEGAFVGSDMKARTVNASFILEEDSDPGDVFVGSLNVVYEFIRPPLEPLAMYVSGGLGLIHRNNDNLFGELEVDADDDGITDATFVISGDTDVAGVLGLGIRYGIRPGVNIRVDIRDYISSFALEIEGFEEPFGSQLQNDLLLTAGVELSFGR